MHVEYRLLSQLIETGDMAAVLKSGIGSDSFNVPECRTLFNAILTYYQGSTTRNLVPIWDYVDEHFPAIELPPASERTTVTALCGEVLSEWVRRKALDAIEECEESIHESPIEAIEALNNQLKSLQRTTAESRDVILASSMQEVKRQYLMAKNAEGYTGIPYPMGWGYHDENGRPKVSARTGRQMHPLNEQTRGMQNGEFILLYGRPKSLKTWLLLDVAHECYMYHNLRVLIFTKEMSPEQLRLRLVARILCVDYMRFKNGELNETEEKEFFDLVGFLQDEEEQLRKGGKNSSLMITTGWQGKNVAGGLDSLQAKIDEFEPNIVLADAVYLMEVAGRGNSAKWQDTTEISRGLKKTAANNGVPLVATSQANRKGEETKGSTMAEIAYSDAFAQDCDLAARIIKRESDDCLKLALIFSGGREITLPGIMLDAKPAEYFRLHQVFESQRQIQAQFKAEEEAMAIEEDRAAARVAGGKRKMTRDAFQEPDPSRDAPQ